MNRLLQVIAVVSVAGFALWGCTSPVPSEECRSNATRCTTPRSTDPCETTVAVSVSGGITPRVDWTPQCGITHLVVVSLGSDGQTGILMWSFSAPEVVPVGPSVHYGVLPTGAILEGPTRPLISGNLYRLTLEMISGTGVITGQGAVTFRP
jgi:hypothetical protein